jgi:transcriptional antiterminator
MVLTARDVQIIKYLLDAEGAVKIKDLAGWLGVTERTIKYDLDRIREWMMTHEIALQSKPNIGLWIEMDRLQKREVHQLLLSNKSSFPNKEGRIKAIIKHLILADGYLTATQISEGLMVSRNTILNDLDGVEEFIAPWQVHLKRQPRIGYRLKGEELHKRILLENLIHRALTHYDIYKVTMQLSGHLIEEPFLIDEPLKEAYELVFNYVQLLYENKPNGNYLLSLLFRLTISIYRLGKKCTLDSYRILDDTLHRSQDEAMVLEVMRKLYGDLNLPLFEDEFYYILRGTEKVSSQVDLAQLTEKIIRDVSQYEGVNYKNDTKLYSNLLAHLSLRFQNEVFNLTEYNPLMDEIKQTHVTLFESTKRAFETHIGHTGDADSFISYMTLHFLVSYEDLKSKKKVNVLYVCSTGKGVARLVKNRVEANIPYIEMVAYCSVMEVELLCSEQPVDMIISVFPIETTLPVVIVDGLPELKDIEKIAICAQRIMNNKHPSIDSYLDLQPSKENVNASSAEISLEIILKGFEISQEIIHLFEEHLQMDKINAFKMHVFLMIHRFYFDTQYDNYAFNQMADTEKVERYFGKLESLLVMRELKVNQTEIHALLQYFK